MISKLLCAVLKRPFTTRIKKNLITNYKHGLGFKPWTNRGPNLQKSLVEKIGECPYDYQLEIVILQCNFK